MSKVKNWRNAATLIIASRMQNNAVPVNTLSSPKEDYQILFLKRSAKSSFMPNKCVFPGGVISPADFSPKWIDLFNDHGIASSAINKLINVSNPSPKLYAASSQPDCLVPELAYRLCALRETFEESGLLISKKYDTQNKEMKRSPVSSVKHLKYEDVNKWRKYVMDDPSMFLELFREFNCVPDVWALHEWSNWLTPDFLSKRFDTLFYLCILENEGNVMEDGMEIVQSQWLSPSEALQQHVEEKIILAPPQIYEMGRLTRDQSWLELSSFVQNRERFGVLRYEGANEVSADGTQFRVYFHGDECFPDNKELNNYPNAIKKTDMKPKPGHNRNYNRYVSTENEKEAICELSICGHRTFEFSHKSNPPSKL